MVLSRCKTYWDGDGIRPLTPEERRQLRGATASMAGKRCLECTAFSYAPVPPEFSWLVGTDTVETIFLEEASLTSAELAASAPEGGAEATDELRSAADADERAAAAEMGVDLGDEDLGDFPRSMSDSVLELREMEVPKCGGDDGALGATAGVGGCACCAAGAPAPAECTHSSLPPTPAIGRRSGGSGAERTRAEAAGRGQRRQASFRRLLREQVFVGVVSALDRARVEAPDFVEDLFNAGVRFVHLSTADERHTKAFGYQLGLETDWNSCIQLGDDADAGRTPSVSVASSVGSGLAQVGH